MALSESLSLSVPPPAKGRGPSNSKDTLTAHRVFKKFANIYLWQRDHGFLYD
jgi:hypothetical protein